MNATSLPPEDELLTWIDDVAHSLEREPFSIPDEDVNMLLGVYGVCAQSIRFSTAYASLYRAGHEREAIVLARAAFEHAITAQWAYFVDGALARLGASAHHTSQGFYVKMGTYLNRPDVVDEALRAYEESGKGMPPFSDRMRALDHGAFLETHYKMFSQYSHVTGSTVTGFLESEGERLALVADPNDPNRHATLYVVAVVTTLAAWILEVLMGGAESLRAFEERADALSLPCSVSGDIDPAIRGKR